jgi:hypothetical protein
MDDNIFDGICTLSVLRSMLPFWLLFNILFTVKMSLGRIW